MVPVDPHPASAHLAAASAAEIAADLAAGRATSVLITRTLLERIAAIDGPGETHLRAVLALAPDAIARAEQLDAERAAGNLRGPLHGVPVLIKDNIEAVGLPGSAGSLALAGRTVTPRLPARHASPRRRARRPRCDEPLRMGQHSFLPVHERLVRGGGLDRQPVGARSQRGRIILGIRCRSRRRPRTTRDRHRDRRIDHLSQLAQRLRRPQTHGWPAPHRRDRSDQRQPGRARADGALGARCRSPARRSDGNERLRRRLRDRRARRDRARRRGGVAQRPRRRRTPSLPPRSRPYAVTARR